MQKSEFEILAGIKIDAEVFELIELDYMNSSFDKDD